MPFRSKSEPGLLGASIAAAAWRAYSALPASAWGCAGCKSVSFSVHGAGMSGAREAAPGAVLSLLSKAYLLGLCRCFADEELRRCARSAA